LQFGNLANLLIGRLTHLQIHGMFLLTEHDGQRDQVMKKSFRDVQKRQLNGDIPIDLWKRVRIQAAERETTLGHVITEALAKQVGVDPRIYGVEPLAN
jgi:hypothetical protein